MAHARARRWLTALALTIALAIPTTAHAEPTPEPTPEPLPSISQPKPTLAWHMPIKGEKLTVKVGTTTPATKATYEWLRGGALIPGANARTYTLTTADVGRKITARVTVAAPGFAPSTKTSAATKAIKARPSLSKSNSLWLVINKKRPLSSKKYVPSKLVKIPQVPGGMTRKLRSDAAVALRKMSSQARKAGAGFSITSGYRSYAAQRSLYNRYVARWGRTSAERFSARPGYSEHQTGLAVDLRFTSTCHLKKCAGATKSGKWVAKNAYKYGFIVRYPQGKEKVTGYKYEPWHLRYVGVDLSTAMHRANITTLEEYFKLGKAPKY